MWQRVLLGLASGAVAYWAFDKLFGRKPKFPSGPMCNGSLLEKFEPLVRATDVVTCTVPKCGQTWLQNILLQMKFKGEFDWVKSENDLLEHSPWMEIPHPPGDSAIVYDVDDRIKLFEASPDPRIFKMHTKFGCIPAPDKCKIVTITRDLRDVPYSFFCHLNAMVRPPMPPFPFNLLNPMYLDNFEKFFESVFIQDSWGMIWGVLQEFWDNRDHPNLLWLRYEDLQNDLPREMRKIATFLEWDWVTDDVIAKCCKNVQFSKLQKAEKDHGLMPKDTFNKPFFRSGKVGENRKKLTPAMEKRLLDVAFEKLPKECVEFVMAQGL